MDDVIAWIIIIGFYAPLHYSMPVLVLFVTGHESDEIRRRLIRDSLIDSSISLVFAFAVAIPLAERGRMLPAMLILLLSMSAPFFRIWRHRREIKARPEPALHEPISDKRG